VRKERKEKNVQLHSVYGITTMGTKPDQCHETQNRERITRHHSFNRTVRRDRGTAFAGHSPTRLLHCRRYHVLCRTLFEQSAGAAQS